jgi:hypothetical protein
MGFTSLAGITKNSATVVHQLAKIATRKGFAYHVIRRMKVAIINYEPLRKNALRQRKALMKLSRVRYPERQNADENFVDDNGA